MLEATLVALLGLGLLLWGADRIVISSKMIAFALGLSPLFIGLTIVAAGTSMPELLISLNSTLKGKGDIAIGNVLGSNVANLCLVLGFVAVLQPFEVHSQVLRWDMPWVTFFTIFLSLAMVLSLESIAIPVLLLLFSVVYLWLLYRKAKTSSSDDPIVAEALEQAMEDKEAVQAKDKISWPKAILYLVIGVAALSYGADFFVDGASNIARLFGVSERAIGLSLVALGTSAPELATSIMAIVRKEGSIAVGNVLGSNIFNIAQVFGICALVDTKLISSGGERFSFDIYAMIFVTLMAYLFMYLGKNAARKEGVALLAMYFGYIYLIF